jgi:MarC family membrane protein
MIEFAAAVFITFLVIIDPIGMVPLFAVLTQRRSKELRRRTAIRSISVAAITLLVIAVIGQIVLRFLGIGLPAFRMAGGLLLLLLSIDMVFARQSGIRSTTDAETEEAEDSTDVAVFPLAIPLIAGPGAMTSIILLMGQLLTVVVGSGLFDLRFDLRDTCLDVGLLTGATDDSDVLLVNRHLFGTAKHTDRHVLKLDTEVRGDHATAGEYRDIFQHRFATIAETRCLNGRNFEATTQLVHDKGRECLAFDLLSDDEEGLAGLHHRLEERQ